MTGRKSPVSLVTGGGGFLGLAIVRCLLRQNTRVRSFSRKNHPELERLGVEQVQGDLRDPESLIPACRNADRVFHTAAKAGVWGDYQDYYETNCLGTENVISACRRCRVSLLIHTSSPSVVFTGKDMEGADESAPYPARFLSHYPETKAMAEQAVIQAARDLRTMVLRPHLIWGPGDPHLTPRILARARRLRRVGNGRNRVDVTYIDNAAHAHLLAAERLAQNSRLSGRVYFISQGEPVLLWEMVDHILKAGGLPPVRGTISRGAAQRIGGVLEAVYRTFRIRSEPMMTRFVADELASSHWFDINAARRDLGYAPQVSIEEGLEKLADYLKRGKH